VSRGRGEGGDRGAAIFPAEAAAPLRPDLPGDQVRGRSGDVMVPEAGPWLPRSPRRGTGLGGGGGTGRARTAVRGPGSGGGLRQVSARSAAVRRSAPAPRAGRASHLAVCQRGC